MGARSDGAAGAGGTVELQRQRAEPVEGFLGRGALVEPVGLRDAEAALLGERRQRLPAADGGAGQDPGGSADVAEDVFGEKLCLLVPSAGERPVTIVFGPALACEPALACRTRQRVGR